MFSTWPSGTSSQKNYQENLELPKKSAKGFKQQLIQVEFEILVLWEKTENADSGFFALFFCFSKNKTIEEICLDSSSRKTFQRTWVTQSFEWKSTQTFANKRHLVKNIGAKIAATKLKFCPKSAQQK